MGYKARAEDLKNRPIFILGYIRMPKRGGKARSTMNSADTLVCTICGASFQGKTASVNLSMTLHRKVQHPTDSESISGADIENANAVGIQRQKTIKRPERVATSPTKITQEHWL